MTLQEGRACLKIDELYFRCMSTAPDYFAVPYTFVCPRRLLQDGGAISDLRELYRRYLDLLKRFQPSKGDNV